jgi:hypothetical protein
MPNSFFFFWGGGGGDKINLRVALPYSYIIFRIYKYSNVKFPLCTALRHEVTNGIGIKLHAFLTSSSGRLYPRGIIVSTILTGIWMGRRDISVLVVKRTLQTLLLGINFRPSITKSVTLLTVQWPQWMFSRQLLCRLTTEDLIPSLFPILMEV